LEVEGVIGGGKGSEEGRVEDRSEGSEEVGGKS